MSGLESGRAVRILEEEVINQNISQYNLSLRKIYSSIDKFDQFSKL
jgi:hypothetical protein